MGILDELDCADTPKSKEIQQSVEEVRARYEKLIRSTAETRQCVEGAATRYEEARAELMACLAWVEGERQHGPGPSA